MFFNNVENHAKSFHEKYLFYRNLGYSVKAAKVLGELTYGDDILSYWATCSKATNKLVELSYWLDAQKASPEDALRSFYWEKHRAKRNNIQDSFPVAEPELYLDTVDADTNAADFGPSDASSFGSHRIKRQRKIRPAVNDSNFSTDLYSLPLDSTTLYLDIEEDAHCSSRVSPEALATDAYEPIEEKAAKGVFTAPTSTFRITTSTASMGILFNQLRSGRHINLDQVRIEEVLNSFDYASKIPTDEKFRIQTELLPKSDNKKLLYINVQACEERREHQNIIALLDVSGSMYGKAEVTQATIATILSKLRPGDTFSLVTYSKKDHTVIDGYRVCDDQDKEILMGRLLEIEIKGCTHGSAGIKTAYELGAKYFREDWNNQVILITDGDLNFGITSKGGLKELIEEKKKSGLFLSVIGTGLRNYKDDKLEVLSKHGNGTYCVVNTLKDVEESIDRRYIALTNIIAKDVKAQVEFNPRLVKSYRLLGYENREISHEAFADDTVISEPYGSGGHGVALYELEMGGAEPSGLKYQTAVSTDSDELCTVKVRYKEPLEDVSHEIEAVVYDRETGTKNAELARLLYCVSEKLRGSDKLDEADEVFLEKMLVDGKYKELNSSNSEKLTLFVEAMLLNGK